MKLLLPPAQIICPSCGSQLQLVTSTAERLVLSHGERSYVGGALCPHISKVFSIDPNLVDAKEL